jgi:lipoyl(octanoyl) transferase
VRAECHNWRLLITPPAPGAWNMAVDEAILEHTGRGESLPTLRLYAWEPACLSLGFAQPFADLDAARLSGRGWGVVRRPTGGRAILHTDELTYSVIAPASDALMAGSLMESYNRLAGALMDAVRALGLPVELNQDRGTDEIVSNPICFEVPSAYEITVGGKKLIGSAQARRKEGVLQHGSLPLAGDLARITEVLVFAGDSDRLEAAQRLLARATTVESVLGHEVLWKDAAQAFIQGFEAQLGLRLEQGELSFGEKKRVEILVREKYDSPDWTKRV